MAGTCALTSGYSWVGCDGGPGGIQQIGFCELANKGAGATISAGVITAWTLVATKVFRKYVLRPETAFWSDKGTKDLKTGAYSFAPTVNLTMNSLATTLRQEILLLMQNNLMCIILDNQGVYRVGGYYYGMQLTEADGQGGTAMQDGQKSILNLIGVDTVPMLEVNAGLIAALMP